MRLFVVLALRDALEEEGRAASLLRRDHGPEVVVQPNGVVEASADKGESDKDVKDHRPGPEHRPELEHRPDHDLVRQTRTVTAAGSEHVHDTVPVSPLSRRAVNTSTSLVEVGAEQEVPPFFICFRGLSKVGSKLCACVLGVAIFAWLSRLCCGERSCWYTWPCCKRLRGAFGVNTEPYSLQLTVHKARDLGSDPTLIAVACRRGRLKPKLKTGVVRTAATEDLTWEQSLNVTVEAGMDIIQVCAVKRSFTKESVVSWADLRMKDLLCHAPGEAALQKEWVPLKDENGINVGSVCLTVQRPTQKGKARHLPKNPDALLKPPTEAEQLQTYTEALSGPLNQANRVGDYKLRYFKVENKRGVWIWSWFKEKHITKDTKPVGRIPLVSILSVNEVPHTNNIAEFTVHYRDATDQVSDMLLERIDRPREVWVKSLSAMVALCLEQRKREKEARATAGTASTRASSATRESQKAPKEPRSHSANPRSPKSQKAPKSPKASPRASPRAGKKPLSPKLTESSITKHDFR